MLIHLLNYSSYFLLSRKHPLLTRVLDKQKVDWPPRRLVGGFDDGRGWHEGGGSKYGFGIRINHRDIDSIVAFFLLPNIFMLMLREKRDLPDNSSDTLTKRRLPQSKKSKRSKKRRIRPKLSCILFILL